MKQVRSLPCEILVHERHRGADRGRCGVGVEAEEVKKSVILCTAVIPVVCLTVPYTKNIDGVRIKSIQGGRSLSVDRVNELEE